MQPTTLALLQLFRADQALREAVANLEAVTREVRTQESRIQQLQQRLSTAQSRLRELQARAANSELELKSREAHIEKLRARQQTASNNKEYQTLLMEINAAKVDKSKLEEATIRLLEQVDSAAAEVQTLTSTLQADQARLAELQARVGDKAAAAQAEVDRLRPQREAAAAALRPELLERFERLAERFDGEVMAAIEKPDPREDEYLCSGCNMALVPNVFNRLKNPGEDKVVACPSCQRILYIPDNFVVEPPQAKKPRARTTRKVVRTPKEETGQQPSRWQALVTAAQGESVRNAIEANQSAVECTVEINGEVVGTFKGKSADHLERVIRVNLEESRLVAEVKVTPLAKTASASPAQNDSPSPSAASGVTSPSSGATADAAP